MNDTFLVGQFINPLTFVGSLLNKLKLGNLIVEAISVRNGNNVQTWQTTTHFEDSAISNSLSTITLKKLQI